MTDGGQNVQGTPPILADDFQSIRPPDPGSREWLVRLLVLFGAGLVLLPNAGAFGLWDCWETHYGEVARYMHETGDLLSPWWGYKEQIGTEARTGEWFFSKPILIMYGEIIFMKLIGLGEWAVRLPWAILGTLGVFFTYVTISRVFSRRTGLLAAGALLTAPLYFFLSRQAITDMPFVGTLTLGLLFFINAYFGPRYTPSKRAFWGWLAAALALFLVSSVPQFVNIALDLEPESAYENMNVALRAWLIFQKTGLYHAAIYFAVTGVLLALIFVPLVREYRAGTLLTPRRMDFWMRRFALWAAYVFLGYATMGKGLLGFMLPGAILCLYFLITGEWRAIKRLEPLRGVLVLCLVMLPWYLGMFAKHGHAFYARFLVHDHFNRLGAGVHQIDSGTFEHFIKWLSVGTFPWIAFAPLLVWGIWRLRLSDTGPRSRLKLFLYVWAFFAYLLFTLSATKFHHYIFPALPPFIMLIGIHLYDFLEDRSWVGRLAALTGVGIILAVGAWIHSDEQAFRNMFTYKYDRPLPEYPPIDADAPVANGTTKVWKETTFWEHTNPLHKTLLQSPTLEYENFLTGYIAVAVIAFLIMIPAYRVRRFGVGALWIASVGLALWCLNYYMPMLSPSWSQKYLFEDYYKRCTILPNPPEVEDAYEPILSKAGLGFIPDYFEPFGKRVCKEDVVAWLITWRGETFYTNSEIKPLMKASQLGPYLETINRGQPFFALTQAGRASGLRTYLDRETKKLKSKGTPEFMAITGWEVETLNQESRYFNLARATPITKAKPAIKPHPDEPRELPEQKLDAPPAM
ncbi:MAG: glycosyltransferase family 39 protein [Deltaproteobacteria bacterium]|nr:glycosyltransferase family 39 protein [Deltaproteobacteria bacterium]